jgi:hypothetical protein
MEVEAAEVFERIYADRVWGEGSGEGSRVIQTLGYVRFIERFLTRNHISAA